jgi:hypothetical protein
VNPATREWSGILDDFECTLDVCEAAMDITSTSGPPAPFAPPVCAAPIPAELGPRATALLARSRDLHQRLQAEQDRIRGELQRLPRAVHDPAETGTTFDFGA